MRCLFRADSVEKVFLGCRTKISRAADAFYARRREGPYRFIQNRPRTFLVALKSDAAAETSKNQLSRDFGADRFSTFATVSANIGSARLPYSIASSAAREADLRHERPICRRAVACHDIRLKIGCMVSMAIVGAAHRPR